MINKEFFTELLENHQKYYKLREELIKNSRQVLKLSKQTIFSLHRDDYEVAGDSIESAEKILREIQDLFEKNRNLRGEGSYREAAEEYIEAKLFLEYLKSKKVEMISDFEFTMFDYLGGISDLTGEILRKAVQAATNKKFDDLDQYLNTMQEIMAELIKFDMTGKLRMKFDAAKRNLRRMEEIIYEVNLKCK